MQFIRNIEQLLLSKHANQYHCLTNNPTLFPFAIPNLTPSHSHTQNPIALGLIASDTLNNLNLIHFYLFTSTHCIFSPSQNFIFIINVNCIVVEFNSVTFQYLHGIFKSNMKIERRTSEREGEVNKYQNDEIAISVSYPCALR